MVFVVFRCGRDELRTYNEIELLNSKWYPKFLSKPIIPSATVFSSVLCCIVVSDMFLYFIFNPQSLNNEYLIFMQCNVCQDAINMKLNGTAFISF